MAFDTFMQIDSVQGESTDEKHINWIGIYSYSHGLSQTGSGSVSTHGARTTGKVDHQDFHITKRIDKSSPSLFIHCCTGKHFPKVLFEICVNTGGKEVIEKYTLEHVLISSLTCGGGDGQDFPVEQVSLQYGKIKWEYFPIAAKDGKKGGACVAEWDLMTNKGG